MKLISVIVPVYNVQAYLQRCVDSILAQTYENLEVILVDDGSPDSCPEICDEYAKKDARVRVIHKENGGLSSARNAGLDIAQGEYIGFVDSDDYISPNMYESLLQRLSEASVRAIANVIYENAWEDGRLTPSVVPHRENAVFSADKYLEELLMHVGDVSACTKLFPKDVIGKTRFANGVLNEDLLFMLDIVERIDEVRFSCVVGYYYFVRPGSISSGYGKAIIDMQKNSLYVFERVSKVHPQLKRQAQRFAIYQNMAYLLALPRKFATKDNDTYQSAKRFIRKNALKGLFNKFLRFKFKLVVCALALFPRAVPSIKRRRK